MHLFVTLSDARSRELVVAAARQSGWEAAWLARLPEPAEAGREDPPGGRVLVHDLLPDPVRQIEHLHALARAQAPPWIFLLLPLSPAVLRTAVGHAAGLPLLAVDICTPDLTPGMLAARLRMANARIVPSLVVWNRVQRWPLPDALRELARETLVGLHLHRCVGSMARGLGIAYERARRDAHRCGLDAPAHFAEMLRLACAVLLLARGAPVQQAAESQGFRDADHLRARLRGRLGLTPSEARHMGADAFLDSLEARWFGGAAPSPEPEPAPAPCPAAPPGPDCSN